MRLTLYVDDLTISVRGAAKFVRNRLAQAVDQVVDTFQNKLALKVSVAKSAVVASSRKLARAVAKRSKGQGAASQELCEAAGSKLWRRL